MRYEIFTFFLKITFNFLYFGPNMIEATNNGREISSITTGQVGIGV